MSAYCVKCRSKTPDVNPVQTTTKNGRLMIKSVCEKCGSKKSEFISNNPNGAPVKKAKKGKGIGRVLRGVFGSLF